MICSGKYRENLGKSPKSDFCGGGGGKERLREGFPEEMTDDPLPHDGKLEELKAVPLDRAQRVMGKYMR